MIYYLLKYFTFFSKKHCEKVQRIKGTGLFYWAVSRCACGREGISPDLPLPGWEATARHSWGGEEEEVAGGW